MSRSLTHFIEPPRDIKSTVRLQRDQNQNYRHRRQLRSFSASDCWPCDGSSGPNIPPPHPTVENTNTPPISAQTTFIHSCEYLAWLPPSPVCDCLFKIHKLHKLIRRLSNRTLITFPNNVVSFENQLDLSSLKRLSHQHLCKYLQNKGVQLELWTYGIYRLLRSHSLTFCTCHPSHPLQLNKQKSNLLRM